MFQQTPRKTVLRLFSFRQKYLLIALLVVPVIILLLPLLLTTKTSAAVSSTTNFQARLETASGAMVPDGNYNVEFKLYDASTSGTLLWTEDHYNNASNGVRIVNGYLTVSLGSLCPFTTGTCQTYSDTAPNWNQQLWLTMNIGGTTTGSPTLDGEMSPRLQLTAVPYAFQAGELGNGTNRATFDSSGNLQFQQASTIKELSGTSGTQLTIQGGNATSGSNVGGTLLLQGGTSASGASGTVLVKSNGSNSTTAFQIQDSSTNSLFVADTSGMKVGIGATDSSTRLNISLDTVDTANGSQLRIGGNLTSTTNDTEGLRVNPTISVSSNSTRGYTGIVSSVYTTDSTHLNGAAVTGLQAAPFYDASSGTLGQLVGIEAQPVNNNAATVTSQIGLYVQTINHGTIGTNYGIEVDNPSNTGTITTNYALVTAANAGNVGIGTVSPASLLTVGGSVGQVALFGSAAGSTDSSYIAAAGGRAMLGHDGSGDIILQGNGGKKLQLAVNNNTFGSGTVGLTVSTAGNVGIGSGATTPGAQLDVAGTTRVSTNSSSALLVQNTSNVALLTADTSNLRVSIGSVGTPTGQLYVSGLVPSGAAGSVTIGGGAHAVYVYGHYAYLASFTTGKLEIYDVSNPASPVAAGSVTAGTNPEGVFVQGKYAYVTNSGSPYTLQIFDVSNPASPVSVGTVSTGLNPYNVYVQGRYAYVTNFNSSDNSVSIIDISDPGSAFTVSTLGLSGMTSPQGVYVQGRYAYVVGSVTNNLKVIDISNPASPSVVGTVSTGTTPFNVYVQGRYAYVTNSGSGTLQVFDISTPSSPTSVSTVSVGTTPQGLSVQGRYAYVSNNGTSTVQVVDVSNPSSMTSVGTVSSASNPRELFAQGRYVYTTSSAATSLQIFDVGGTYSQQLEAGGITTGSLETRGNVNISGDASLLGGLTVGASLNVNGALSANGIVVGAGQNAESSVSLLVLDNKSGSGDPSNCFNGGLYYNANSNQFRGCRNGTWYNLIAGVDVQNFTASNSWTKPNGVTFVMIIACGGGGGGGGGFPTIAGQLRQGGSGGGGGAYATRTVLASTLGSSVSFTIGGGGSGGGSNASGSAGGATTFGSSPVVLTAAGGGAGVVGQSSGAGRSGGGGGGFVSNGGTGGSGASLGGNNLDGTGAAGTAWSGAGGAAGGVGQAGQFGGGAGGGSAVSAGVGAGFAGGDSIYGAGGGGGGGSVDTAPNQFGGGAGGGSGTYGNAGGPAGTGGGNNGTKGADATNSSNCAEGGSGGGGLAGTPGRNGGAGGVGGGGGGGGGGGTNTGGTGGAGGGGEIWIISW